MKSRKWLILAGVLVAGWLIGDFYKLAQKARPRQASFSLHGAAYHVSGPYAYENLAVFLIHAPNQDEREFITLDQGLKDGTVKITEKGEGQVSELVLDNQGDLPLFLQEGDRVKGGKQDRTIASSFVIPGKSGPSPLPAFCIESGRWTARFHQQDRMSIGHEAAAALVFDSTSNTALAPKEVRQAAKYSNSQPEVWANVHAGKVLAAGQLSVSNTTTSLNEALDSPQVQKLSDEFANALSGALRSHRDAVGVAIVINGEIEEVNIYPNHQLLTKLYPRLLQSYALAAALAKDAETANAKPLAATEICRWMTEGAEKSQDNRAFKGTSNTLNIRYLEGAKAAACTTFENRPVHVQFMSKAPEGRAAGQAGQPAPSVPMPSLPPGQ